MTRNRDKLNATRAVTTAATKKDVAVDTAITSLPELVKDSRDASGFEKMGVDDLAIPFLVLLQPLSPQVAGAGKLPGARPGMIYNTVTGALYEPPVVVVPCAYQRLYIEWIPRAQGGGFVTSHTDEAIIRQTTRNAAGVDVLPNGHEIRRTAYHYVLLLGKSGPQPAVIGMTSTQLKYSRRWNAAAMGLKVTLYDGTIVTPPMYSHSYELGTMEESNEKGTWWSWKIGAPVMLTDANIYRAARSFYQAVASGMARVGAPPVDVGNELVTADDAENTL